jgi:recombination protein RecA
MSGSWLDALQATKIKTSSARDALQVRGWLDTGAYALNWAISGRFLGGYPLGHTLEIFGDPSTGKSFLAARAIAMAQKADGVALLDDTEGAYNIEHTAKIGVNVDSLAVSNSRTVREHLRVAQGFFAAYKSMDPPGPGVCVLDSIAQLSTEHELDTQLDKRDMTKAAELKALYRIIQGEVTALPVLHLATNHTIAAIGSFTETRTTPGGGGPKFTATVRIDLRATSKVKAGTGAGAEVTGIICRAVIAKNRIAPPFKEVRLTIPYYKPISRASGLLPILVGLGVVEERGNFLFFEGNKVGRSFKSKGKALEMDDLGEEILEQAPEILEAADRISADKQGQSENVIDLGDAEEVEDEVEE